MSIVSVFPILVVPYHHIPSWPILSVILFNHALVLFFRGLREQHGLLLQVCFWRICFWHRKPQTSRSCCMLMLLHIGSSLLVDSFCNFQAQEFRVDGSVLLSLPPSVVAPSSFSVQVRPLSHRAGSEGETPAEDEVRLATASRVDRYVQIELISLLFLLLELFFAVLGAYALPSTPFPSLLASMSVSPSNLNFLLLLLFEEFSSILAQLKQHSHNEFAQLFFPLLKGDLVFSWVAKSSRGLAGAQIRISLPTAADSSPPLQEVKSDSDGTYIVGPLFDDEKYVVNAFLEGYQIVPLAKTQDETAFDSEGRKVLWLHLPSVACVLISICYCFF